eukprot:TRINITY_DN6546_c1_g1_i2.p1 TRINITY_DN6546_c1_g1~~TRINITY_DN6546_c1_g1_i2.p1  ORF type:complete len:680 (+),score=86.22 TRINITY_DN6546_c1_g1_i2:28-2040(+)
MAAPVGLTTNQGLPISDNQNSLSAGARGPVLLEDFVLREKITHFDHERIPERVVHARGSGAHGYFQPYASAADLTEAAFLQDATTKTSVFVRFSTALGGAASIDVARDVRGFAVKFYTTEGVFDLVGNNMPVFFIQDSIKFPDLIHAGKPEPHSGMPQASTAHTNFWDFVSLTPETMHMILWVMSDRGIPRSYRMMEGFGVNTYRFVNRQGKACFVKFHWRPLIGTASVLWDEALKINAADPDFHRRDLWEAISQKNYPEYELGVQVIDEDAAQKLDFDVLDATKLIPEEVIPIRPLGKMVLNKNPDNFFAETEQVAFCPSHIVRGIDFSDDPLLQGRLFSYLDTQLIRLGGPNFHQLPINAPRCPVMNFQRDGWRQMHIPVGSVNYDPSQLATDTPQPRQSQTGFRTHAHTEGEAKKVRMRPESFADHYSQARMFFRSLQPPEQEHLCAALIFEISHVDVAVVRDRLLAHLNVIDQQLQVSVASGLGMATSPSIPLEVLIPPRDLPPSPALSIHAKAPETLRGRKAGILLADGFNSAQLNGITGALLAEEATAQLIAPCLFVTADDSTVLEVHHTLAAAPSAFFDLIIVLGSSKSSEELKSDLHATNWIRDAFLHRKFIGHSPTAGTFVASIITPDAGVRSLSTKSDVEELLALARKMPCSRLWARLFA